MNKNLSPDPPKNAAYTSSTPESELILAAREGSDAAFDLLVRKYRPMLDAALAQYRSEMSPEDIEDIGQEALLAFHRAALTFRADVGRATFGLYARTCVNNAIVTAVRRIMRTGQGGEVISLEDASLEELPAEQTDPAGEFIAREAESELRRAIRGALSDYENRVWWMHVAGFSMDEIAAETGKPRKSVDNALCRIKKKLRELLA